MWEVGDNPAAFVAGRLPQATLVMHGSSYVKISQRVWNLVRVAMLPARQFRAALVFVEDAADPCAVSYCSTLDMLEDFGACGARRRLRPRSAEPGASACAAALEAGRLLAACGPGDRVVVFTDSAALGQVLAGYHPACAVVQPLLHELHDAWWDARARRLLRPPPPEPGEEEAARAVDDALDSLVKEAADDAGGAAGTMIEITP